MLVVGENGQMEINFEALELITNSEFVNVVKLILNRQKNNCKLFVENKFGVVSVYIKDKSYMWKISFDIALVVISKNFIDFNDVDIWNKLEGEN